jgi:hypothetical protein
MQAMTASEPPRTEVNRCRAQAASAKKNLEMRDKPTLTKRHMSMENVKLSHTETASLLTAAIVLAVLGIVAI